MTRPNFGRDNLANLGQAPPMRLPILLLAAPLISCGDGRPPDTEAEWGEACRERDDMLSPDPPCAAGYDCATGYKHGPGYCAQVCSRDGERCEAKDGVGAVCDGGLCRFTCDCPTPHHQLNPDDACMTCPVDGWAFCNEGICESDVEPG